jgi:dihydrodipicolinate synthase/N-acetylneuraminate lyase
MSNLTGVFPVFQTPFHDDESIDFATLAVEIEWLFDRGASGIVMAMVSETLRMSSEERDELAGKVCSLAAGKGPVVISVGAESSHSAIRHAKHAEAQGAAAVMAIPPISIALGRDELHGYYRSILEAVAIPVIVQDASGYVGRPMPVEMQAQILSEFGDERVLFKPEATPIGPNLSALRDATGGKAKIFEGSGGISLVNSYRRGIVGTMPGAEIIDAQVALWRALGEGSEERIYRLSFPISSLVALQSGLDGFLAVEKYLLVKQGIFPNATIRGPVGYVLDEETRQEVDRLFEILMTEVRSPGLAK